MKVLLDENLPHALRRYLDRHDTFTASYAGFAGLKNGALLNAAIQAGFDVLVTGDRTIQYEQNLTGLPIALVSLSENAWQTIRKHTDVIARAVDQAVPGSFTQVDCGASRRPLKVGSQQP